MTGDIIGDLRWRGLIAQTTDEAALAGQLAKPTTLYCGFDPTADSLHVGNLLGLLVLRRFQQAGHRPIVLAGGATGMVGDPREVGERVMYDADTVAAWTENIRGQLARFVEFGDGPNAALAVNNLEWTAPLTAIQFLRDIGKHFSVNVMLARETIRARLAGEGISYTEFSYLLLQSLDYLELFRRHDCRLQIGGSDQWGNILGGVDLIRRLDGEHVHALTTTLITSAAGEKFGKSTGGGSLWLDPDLTSPYAFYQYWINVDDRDAGRYLRYFTFLAREEIEALDAETVARPQARVAQRRLAEELTTLVHGAGQTRRVVAASAALFGRGDLRELDEATLTAALSEAPNADVANDATLVDLLVETGLCGSKSEARRVVAEGGGWVNNERWTDPERRPGTGDRLAGGWIVLRRGRRTLAGARLGR